MKSGNLNFPVPSGPPRALTGLFFFLHNFPPFIPQNRPQSLKLQATGSKIGHNRNPTRTPIHWQWHSPAQKCCLFPAPEHRSTCSTHCCSFCLFTADASRNHHLPGRSCEGCWCRCEWISGVLHRTRWWQGAWHRWRRGSKPDQRGRRCRLLLHKPAASRTSHRQQESRLRTYAALSSYNCSFGKDYNSTLL